MSIILLQSYIAKQFKQYIYYISRINTATFDSISPIIQIFLWLLFSMLYAFDSLYIALYVYGNPRTYIIYKHDKE